MTSWHSHIKKFLVLECTENWQLLISPNSGNKQTLNTGDLSLPCLSNQQPLIKYYIIAPQLTNCYYKNLTREKSWQINEISGIQPGKICRKIRANEDKSLCDEVHTTNTDMFVTILCLCPTIVNFTPCLFERLRFQLGLISKDYCTISYNEIWNMDINSVINASLIYITLHFFSATCILLFNIINSWQIKDFTTVKH